MRKLILYILLFALRVKFRKGKITAKEFCDKSVNIYNKLRNDR